MAPSSLSPSRTSASPKKVRGGLCARPSPSRPRTYYSGRRRVPWVDAAKVAAVRAKAKSAIAEAKKQQADEPHRRACPRALRRNRRGPVELLPTLAPRSYLGGPPGHVGALRRAGAHPHSRRANHDAVEPQRPPDAVRSSSCRLCATASRGPERYTSATPRAAEQVPPTAERSSSSIADSTRGPGKERRPTRVRIVVRRRQAKLVDARRRRVVGGAVVAELGRCRRADGGQRGPAGGARARSAAGSTKERATRRPAAGGTAARGRRQRERGLEGVEAVGLDERPL